MRLDQTIRAVNEGIDYLKNNMKMKGIILLGLSMGAALLWKVAEKVQANGAIMFYGVCDLKRLR